MGVYFADTGNKFKVWKRSSSLFQAAGRPDGRTAGRPGGRTARRPDSPAAGRLDGQTAERHR